MAHILGRFDVGGMGVLTQEGGDSFKNARISSKRVDGPGPTSELGFPI